jgi:uncharacterized protein (DUF2147 family)
VALPAEKTTPSKGTSVVKRRSSRLSWKFILAAAAAVTLVYSAHASAPAVGTWLSTDGGTKVRVTECGDKLCGHVVWLNDPTGADGKPKTDKHNADASKRARPLLGVQVVLGLKADGANMWSGQIYNADDGKIYQAHVIVVSENAMTVQGCVLGILCKSQTWTRAD